MATNDTAAAGVGQVREEAQDEVAARLAKITAMVAARTGATTSESADTEEKAIACPIDPAERELCDFCQ